MISRHRAPDTAHYRRRSNYLYNLPAWELQRRWVAQGGLCAVCQQYLGDKGHFDHNHDTGLPRGWLCPRCNLELASLESHPERWTDAVLEHQFIKDPRE